MTSMPVCNAPECSRPVHCKGLCQPHYRRHRGLVPAGVPEHAKQHDPVQYHVTQP